MSEIPDWMARQAGMAEWVDDMEAQGVDRVRLVAAMEILGRAAASSLEVGRDRFGRWDAMARWGGEIVAVEGRAGPLEALEELARKALGPCTRCGRRATLDAPGDDVCRFTLVNGSWQSGCGLPPATGSKHALASALSRVGAGDMARQALKGYYHDFESPLAFPQTQLVADLRARGLEAIAQQVINGDFDATREESAAWAASPEGAALMEELLGIPHRPGQPDGPAGQSRQQRRAAERRKR